MKKIILLFMLILLIPANYVSANENITNNDVMLEKAEIKQYGLPFLDMPFIDEDKLNSLIEDLEEKIYQAPVNARLDEKGEILDGEPGFALDKEEFQGLFRESFYTESDKKLNVPKQQIYPTVDSELLDEISNQEIGSYVTTFKESNVERSHNIALSTEAINNHVVFPGETFSFNEVVGERTEEKGYMQAPVIVKGELAEDIGGGICQVSSTLYNAVDLEGIEIVERYAHSRSVPYVPPGRDATVSWWGPDFVFKNMYNEPILLRAKADNGNMVVTVYASDTIEYASNLK
ncbi:VanW family protein [Virgibacillus sp. NKC19-16]|uniref:VanW family protein n=1 Tax=Virgibacillus salidurans TaxID=2831673 RepID=UPI001F41924E|nr:VanW family protein [Virgibacillus sp. NKC19-16]UJL47761.1 VanW family protein [Virgibacillus sp. NKC19-16]